MGGRTFVGPGVGIGAGTGCGFGVGWGFGGGSIGFGGLGAGGGCGVGVGLGWGWGAAFGSNYIQVDPEFESSRDNRPRWLRMLQDQASVLKYERHSSHKD
mmetsp:Transcript_30207/g.89645  ORF Transcript_30207/g.89645 Transcript_30207/m.89645 type:complete len:100 (-) Transcript_30207:592-891(-)